MGATLALKSDRCGEVDVEVLNKPFRGDRQGSLMLEEILEQPAAIQRTLDDTAICDLSWRSLRPSFRIATGW